MNSPHDAPDPVVWLDRRFVPAGEATVSPFDRGFLYGDGLFETLRAEGGRVFHLERHLQRLQRSLAALRIPFSDDLDWQSISGELLHRNGLSRGVAAVKILITRGVAPGLGLPTPRQPTICLTAMSYTPPADTVYGTGWRLHVFREGFAPPLAMFKSLNYLYFLAARQAALEAGADEAVILDPWDNVTETAAGSLMLRSRGAWRRPASPYQLAGTTADAFQELIEQSGLAVTKEPCTLKDLFSAETVWVLNSLMGIMPVSAISGRPVPDPAPEEAARWRKRLFEA